MRRDQLEIGLEREYAVLATTGDRVAYLLACERLLALFHEHTAGDRWRQMQSQGWRIAPEYSKCLVEIASPPYLRAGWSELLAGFELAETWLARAAELLQAQSRFERIECTARYSVRTDRFVAWDGAAVTSLGDILLDPAGDNWLVGTPDSLPPCLDGSAAELLYAGFTSTNATLHPPMDRDIDAELAHYYWHVLHAARQIEVASPQRHAFLRDGHVAVAPDPELSVRDALIRWGDPPTAVLLDTLAPDGGAARFQELFGQLPSPSFTAAGFRAYSCRPRVVDDTMLFELRCFHSGLPLARLEPLLGARIAAGHHGS